MEAADRFLEDINKTSVIGSFGKIRHNRDRTNMCACIPLKSLVSVLVVKVPRFHQPSRLLNSLIMGKPKCKAIEKSSPTLYGNQTSALSSKPNKTLTISVEGNIASGKTTFLEHFKKYKDVEVFEEPVKKWRNIDGHNALAKMYEDPARWSLTLQTYVQLTMLQQHTLIPKTPVKLMERSIYSAKYCFVENLYNSGKMTDMEYVILTEWFNWIVKNHNLNVDLFVYLRTSPEVVHERIRKRCRAEETTIPLEYLQTLHDLHEDWLVKQTKYKTNSQIMILDANQKSEEIVKIYQDKSEEILFGQNVALS